MGKVYHLLPDKKAAKDDFVRVVDETGEDYLFPQGQFVFVDFPKDVKKCWRSRIVKEHRMKATEKLIMGRFKVDVELANNDDISAANRGDLDAVKVRRVTIQAVVDSGATRLVLPGVVARELGLTATEKVGVRYADGRRAKRDRVQGVYLKLLGRDSVFSAAVEPKRESALLGAIVLEELDFLVDCTNQRLVPRDPKYIISEIE